MRLVWLRKSSKSSCARGLGGGRRAGHAVFTAPLLMALALHAVPAVAQDAKELARARAIFQQATELEQAGNWAAAVQKFREVGQVRMTPQVRFHIALCEDKLGRLVAALGGYELALADADSVGPDFRAEVEGNVNRLRERIPKLVIQRGAGAEAAVIELDGVSVGDNSVGVDLPQDPGPHAVTAHAPHFLPFEATVALAEGERKVVEIVMMPATVEKSPAQPLGPAAPPPRKVNLVPFIVGGAGAATLLVSGVFFALRQSSLSTLDDSCMGTQCKASDLGEYNRLKIYHYTAFVTLGVGVGALGTGAALYVLDLRKQKREQQQQTAFVVVPSVSPEFAGVSSVIRF